MNKNFWLPLFLFTILFSQSCYANVVWPGLYLSGRMIVWTIPTGIFIEIFILKSILQKGWGYTLLVTTVANIISTIVGAVGAILGNLAFEFTIGQILYKFLNIGTFNPLSWASAIFFGAFISTIIEIYSLKIIFKIKLISKQRLIFLGANLLSTLIAFVSILIKRPFY